ncbi:MAG: TrmB family transcriptional regulator sugar-binding domain-containing protein, partial [Candidatus Woesearchaeota archaeon]
RSRSYDVLESLEKKGFIIMKLGKPIKYIAVPPSEVIERMKEKIAEEAKRKAVFLEKIKNDAILEKLELLHNNGMAKVNKQDLIGSIKGKQNIYHHIRLIIKSAKKSILITASKTTLLEIILSLKGALEKARANGAHTLIIAPDKKLSTDIRKLLPFVKVKACKHNSDVAFIVVDKKDVLLTAFGDSTLPANSYAIWASNESFAKGIEDVVLATMK